LATRFESALTFSVAAAWEGVNLTSLPASFHEAGLVHINTQFKLSIVQFNQTHDSILSETISSIQVHFQTHIAAKARIVFLG
jgi:hypothetical protein